MFLLGFLCLYLNPLDAFDEVFTEQNLPKEYSEDTNFESESPIEYLRSRPDKFIHRRLHNLLQIGNNNRQVRDQDQPLLVKVTDVQPNQYYSWNHGWLVEIEQLSSTNVSEPSQNAPIIEVKRNEIESYMLGSPKFNVSSGLHSTLHESQYDNTRKFRRYLQSADGSKIRVVKSHDRHKREVYLIDGDVKHLIDGMGTLTGLGYSFPDIVGISDSELSHFSVGDSVNLDTLSADLRTRYAKPGSEAAKASVGQTQPQIQTHERTHEGSSKDQTGTSEAQQSQPSQSHDSHTHLENVWSRFVQEHSIAKRASIPNRHYKIYYAIFAGRRQFMNVTLKYLDVLLQERLIDEVHIWDFVSTDEQDKCSDSLFLENYVRNTEVSGYILFKRSRFDFKRMVYNLNHGYLWGSFYSHYQTNRRYKNDDIFIKGDDDIVFIDVAHFHKFTEAIASRTYNQSIHFPNIINNDVGFAIQAKRIDSPVLKSYYEHYERIGINFDEGMNTFYKTPHDGWHHPSWDHLDYYEVFPLTGWDAGTFSNGEFAADIHNLFLQNPLHFITRSRGLHMNATRFVEASRRISVNMFGTTFQNARDVMYNFLTNYCCDDEGFIGMWPSISGFRHVIDTALTVSHMSFKPQKKAKDLSLQNEQYNRIGELMLKEYSIPRTTDFESKLLSYNSIVMDGSLIKIDSRKSDGNTVYLIESCQRRPFASRQAFANRGYDMANVIALPSDFVLNIPEGKEVE